LVWQYAVLVGKERSMNYPFIEGVVVQAQAVITEGGPGTEPDLSATKFVPGYVHAEARDFGVVVCVDDGTPTIRFYPKGTATIVGEDEVQAIPSESTRDKQSIQNRRKVLFDQEQCRTKEGRAVTECILGCLQIIEDVPPHITLSKISPEDQEKVTAEIKRWRKDAKSISFGDELFYGKPIISAKSLCALTNDVAEEVDREQEGPPTERDHILRGMGVPKEFLDGSLTEGMQRDLNKVPRGVKPNTGLAEMATPFIRDRLAEPSHRQEILDWLGQKTFELRKQRSYAHYNIHHKLIRLQTKSENTMQGRPGFALSGPSATAVVIVDRGEVDPRFAIVDVGIENVPTIKEEKSEMSVARDPMSEFAIELALAEGDKATDFAGSRGCRFSAETCLFVHDQIKFLRDMLPTSIDALPRTCSCGASLTYDKDLQFVHRRPATDREREFFSKHLTPLAFDEVNVVDVFIDLVGRQRVYFSRERLSVLFNHYIALVDRDGRCIVTLPHLGHGITVSVAGEIEGLTGAEGIWNGEPKPWCYEIVEVYSREPWATVPDEDKTVLWCSEQ